MLGTVQRIFYDVEGKAVQTASEGRVRGPSPMPVTLRRRALYVTPAAGLALQPRPDRGHAGTMMWEDLAQRQVAQLGRGDTILMLWACWQSLRQSMKLMNDRARLSNLNTLSIWPAWTDGGRQDRCF